MRDFSQYIKVYSETVLPLPFWSGDKVVGVITGFEFRPDGVVAQVFLSPGFDLPPSEVGMGIVASVFVHRKIKSA